jgi:hypothetical protein
MVESCVAELAQVLAEASIRPSSRRVLAHLDFPRRSFVVLVVVVDNRWPVVIIVAAVILVRILL